MHLQIHLYDLLTAQTLCISIRPVNLPVPALKVIH